MNPLDLTYCEDHLWLHMTQPWNTISNGAFFIVALLLWLHIRGTALREDRALIWLIASVALIGACSTFWHATLYPWSLIIDVIGIVIFTTGYIYYTGSKYLNFSKWKSTGALIAVIIACVVAMTLTDAHMAQRSGAFIPLSLLFFGIAAKLWKASKKDALYFVGAGVSMAVAIVARVVDLPVCDHIHMGTHFIWHSLTAVTTYCLMMPVLNFHPRR